MHPPPSGLRPDAAVFIPSGAVSAVNTKASGSVSTNDIARDYDKQSYSNIHVSDKQSRGRTSRNKLRRKKSRMQRNEDSTNETCKLDSKTHNVRINSSNGIKMNKSTREKNQSKTGNHQMRSRKKPGKHCRQTNHHSMGKSTKSTSGKDSATFPIGANDVEYQIKTDSDNDGNADNLTKEEFELASSSAFPALIDASWLIRTLRPVATDDDHLSLMMRLVWDASQMKEQSQQEEALFSALGASDEAMAALFTIAPKMDEIRRNITMESLQKAGMNSGTTSSSRANNNSNYETYEDPAKTSSSESQQMQPTIWDSLETIEKIRGESVRHEYNSGDPQEVSGQQTDENWQDGLHRLTSRGRKSKNKSDDHRHDTVEEKVGEEGKTQNKVMCDSNKDKAIQSPLATIMPKRTFDMNRMRDRWWMAVANQQRRIQHQQAQEKLRSSSDTDSNMSEDGVGKVVQIDHGGGSYDCCNGLRSTNNENRNESIRLSALQQQETKNNTLLTQSTTAKLELLHSIIDQFDDLALRDMIQMFWNNEHEIEQPNSHCKVAEHQISLPREDLVEKSDIGLVEHAIEVVISRNHPKLLRTILSVTGGRVPVNSKPLIHAARLGHEECASILLLQQEKGSTMLFLNDADGNTALHYCCRENGNKAMLVTLLKQVTGNTKAKHQQLSKLLTARNKNLKTPLHIACESGRSDLVEVFLMTCRSSLLFKILSIEDVNSETPLLCAVSNRSYDVVLSLLMWRRNHSQQQGTKSNRHSATRPFFDNINNIDHILQSNEEHLAKCPLVWAAKSGNLEMIDLLIQFGEQSGTLYQITDALMALLLSDVSNEIKLRGSDSLILAGGNIFKEITCPGLNSMKKETSINAAMQKVSSEVIRSISSTALRKLNERQLLRRRDPVLQRQPEAFFMTLETKERVEIDKAIKNALIETLFRAHLDQKLSDFTKAVVLYEQIEKVEEKHLGRLQASMRTGAITSMIPKPKNWCFLATYDHAIPEGLCEGSKSRDYDRTLKSFMERSSTLLQSRWALNGVQKTECSCPWMSEYANNCHPPSNFLEKDTVILITDDGSRFLVHTSIASEKSGKIASAVRFAQMKWQGDPFDEDIEVEISIKPDLCKLLIQHMYHGSICFGWPNLEENELCRYLLELMVVAEEFLVPSLVQEIEMRLMSSKPLACFCWDCCKALRITSSNDGKKQAQCLFLASGNSSLVNKDTAVDVLSLTDYIGGLDYNIFLAPTILDFCDDPEKLWANYDKEVKKQEFWKANKALASLKSTATVTILKEFAHVVKSDDFHLTNEDEQRNDQKEILLRICLDELRNNSVIG